VLTAAQNVSSLCSICATPAAPFARDQMAFVRVSQPLQQSTGLRLTLRPVSNSGSSSLLVSPVLPRSLLDFISIADTGVNRSVLLTAASETGSYWAAVYANTPGSFVLAASRAKLPVPAQTATSSLQAFIAFVLGSTAAKVVLGVGGALLLAMVLGCVADCCCSKSMSMGRLRARLAEVEEEHERQEALRRRSMTKLAATISASALAQTPALQASLDRHTARYGGGVVGIGGGGGGGRGSGSGSGSTRGHAITTVDPLHAPNPIARRAPAVAAVSLLAQSMTAGSSAMRAELAHLGVRGDGSEAALRPESAVEVEAFAERALGSSRRPPSAMGEDPLRAQMRASKMRMRAGAAP
jgi:hypothetical protein